MAHRSFKESGLLLAVRGLRLLERVLPVPALGLVCWPVAAARSLVELLRTGPTIGQFDRMPDGWRGRRGRGAWLVCLWRERCRLHLAWMSCLWPDRLGEGRWERRCCWVGFERLGEARDRGRPVVLAMLHFGLPRLLC